MRDVAGERNDLLAFAYTPSELPEYLTRARTLVDSADSEAPIVFMDTGPAAALGALQDPIVGERDEQTVLNLGNMHALAFHLRGTEIISLYEHHTGEVTVEQIEDFTERLIGGDLPHDDVFNSKGHGVYYADAERVEPNGERLIAVTGPQRSKIRGSRLKPYFAVPHGDMMVSGCFGLLWAFAEKHPQHSDEILSGLGIATATT
jgi:uncharacterized protein (DUF1786 family)